ncbi:hypothetical protein B0H13DRAFT_2315088 [Mycena leptocephala]|nr:hypothetical protein B0H13DRAFT_2315088 [Mycena leptocephala]
MCSDPAGNVGRFYTGLPCFGGTGTANKSRGDLSTNDDVFRSAAKGSYANLYCLVALPSLQDSIPTGARSKILIRAPPKSVLKGAKWLQDVAPQTGDTTAFIMDVENTAHAEDRPPKSISLMSHTSEEYLWCLPIPLKVVLAVLIQASISIMDSELGTNDGSHSLSGSSPPPPLLFGAAAPVIIKNFKFEFQYVFEPHEASEVGATGHTLPIQGSYRSSDEIPYTAEGAMLACSSMLPALVTQLATLKVGRPMRKRVWRNYITRWVFSAHLMWFTIPPFRLTEPEKVVTRIALRGPTGAGKSSLVNALLGACSATPIEIPYHGKATIQADIHFVRREEWFEDLQQLRDDIRDFSDTGQKRVEIAWSKVHAVYAAFKYGTD